MDQSVQTPLQVGGPVHSVNVEYFFKIIYDLLYGAHTQTLAPDNLLVVAGHLWLFVSVVSYLIALACIWALIYYTLRYWQIKKEDEAKYTTISEAEEHTIVEHERWAYIQQLAGSPAENDWRQAIIEADIMLDEVLERNGVMGATIGDRLQTAKFGTLQQAWDAHRVRNEIAHQGSAYQLSPTLTQRTLANYEAVFQEFNEL